MWGTLLSSDLPSCWTCAEFRKAYELALVVTSIAVVTILAIVAWIARSLVPGVHAQEILIVAIPVGGVVIATLLVRTFMKSLPGHVRRCKAAKLGGSTHADIWLLLGNRAFSKMLWQSERDHPPLDPAAEYANMLARLDELVREQRNDDPPR